MVAILDFKMADEMICLVYFLTIINQYNNISLPYILVFSIITDVTYGGHFEIQDGGKSKLNTVWMTSYLDFTLSKTSV